MPSRVRLGIYYQQLFFATFSNNVIGVSTNGTAVIIEKIRKSHIYDYMKLNTHALQSVLYSLQSIFSFVLNFISQILIHFLTFENLCLLIPLT